MKKLKGFTLVELIIVIVIIGILAAVTIIGYVGQAAKARNNSAFVSLSEAVKAANVCVTTDTLKAYSGTSVLNASTPNPICIVNTTVAGNWPDLKDLGGFWTYMDFSSGVRPANFPAGTLTNTVTTATVTGIYATNFGTTPAVGDPGVYCTMTGCSKGGTTGF